MSNAPILSVSGGTWTPGHQQPLRGVRQRRRSPRVRLLQRIVALYNIRADVPGGRREPRRKMMAISGLALNAGLGQKTLREARTEAPGGGRCAQQAGATATVILERCYVVTPLRLHPSSPPNLVILE